MRERHLSSRILRKAATVSVLAILVTNTIEAAAEEEPKGTAAVLMEEVLVTARKKSEAEALQDVPLSITAYSGAQLEALFVESLIDIGHLSPNVSFDVNQSTPGFQSFHIRGTGLVSSTLSTDPAVGVFLDGMYMGLPAGVVMDTFDLESVEILRGPQGTLFGRNVTGGAVTLKTRRPSQEFGVRTRAILGSDDRYELAASVTGGLTENAAGKLTVFFKEQGPTYDNVAPAAFAPGADDVGDRDLKAIRPSFSVDVTDDLHLELLAEYGEATHSVGARQIVDNDDAVALLAKSIPGLPFPTNNDVSLDFTPKLDSDWFHVIAEATWQLRNGSLKSITTYRDYQQVWASDADGSALFIFNSGDASSIEQDQLSQEIVYNVNLAESIDLTTGIYYFDQSYTSFEERQSPFFPSGFDYSIGDVDHQTYGVFAQSDFRPLDDLTITFGGRFTNETKDAVISRLGSPGDCAAGYSSCVPGIDDDDDWTNFSPKLGIRWQFLENAQTYASYTKGFRSGGFNIRTTTDVARYDEEEIDAYEIGLKSDWADGKFRFNAAYFHNDVSDMQRIVNLPGAIGGSQALLNAAEGSIQGIEIEGAVQLVDNLFVRYNLGWMDAEYDRYDNLDVDRDGTNTPDPEVARNLAVPRIPEWTRGVAATYDLAIASGHLVFRADYSYTDSQYFDDRNLVLGPQYELYNASIAYVPDNGSWKITMFGKNLKDARYYTGGFETSSWDFWDLGARRSWGLELLVEL